MHVSRLVMRPCAGHKKNETPLCTLDNFHLPKHPRILIRITTSHISFNERVYGFLQTWGAEALNHASICVFFFVSEDAYDKILEITFEVGLKAEMIVPLADITDDEYPPVLFHPFTHNVGPVSMSII